VGVEDEVLLPEEEAPTALLLLLPLEGERATRIESKFR
jgi:hypothetical protein